MKYGYEIIKYKREINKKKVFFTILIFCLIIGVIVGSIIFNMKLKIEEERKQQEIIEKAEEEKRLIEEEKKRKIQEEKNRKENIIHQTALTEEQLERIENIYDDVGEKRVFLTFDDGPTESVTPFILDLLKKENIKATFFVLGTRVEDNPELIKREYEEGHYIANHGYTHKYSEIYKNTETVVLEYDYTEKAIQEALNDYDYHSKVFRFPGGSVGGYYKNVKSIAYDNLKNNGIASVDWNSLSRDAEGANTTEELFNNVIETIGDKQSVVILMHDASDKILTYEVLPKVIEYLKENGYSFKNFYDIL